jgi:uncharacterized membrane protein
MAVLLGVFVAASFGSGDFLGGTASRRATTLPVLAIAQLAALVGAVVYAVVLGGAATGRDVGYGLGAGAVGVVALGCLYAGLATGRMGIVAPVTAVIAACIPVGWGLLKGEDVSATALVGVGLAIVAGGLVASEHDAQQDGATRALGLAVTAGLLFGTSLVLLSETGDGSGAWPVLAGRVAAVVVVLGGVLVARRSLSLDTAPRRMAMGAGLFDVTGTALLLVAIRDGFLATVAPVAALGPAFTVVCAWLFLREPASRLQLVGLVLAVTGLVLIATGT